MIESYEGWIDIHNLPQTLWTPSIFKHIGDSCGGYLYPSNQIERGLILSFACLKIKDNPRGFILNEVHLLADLAGGEITVKIQAMFIGQMGRHKEQKPMTIFSINKGSMIGDLINSRVVEKGKDLAPNSVQLDSPSLFSYSEVSTKCPILKEIPNKQIPLSPLTNITHSPQLNEPQPNLISVNLSSPHQNNYPINPSPQFEPFNSRTHLIQCLPII